MTDEKFQQLATLYLENAIDETDRQLLERELAQSSDRVRQFNDLRILAGLIHEHGRSEIEPANVPDFPPGEARRTLQRSWMSTAALVVASLVMGSLTTVALLTTYANAESTKLRRISIFNGGFEVESFSPKFGYPDTVSVWTGDRVEVVESGHQGIPSFEGKRMLRFTQTWGKASESKHYRSNLWQLVDLGEVERGDDFVIATVRARFNRIDAGPDTDSSFFVQVLAFAGHPSTVEAQHDRQDFLVNSRRIRQTDAAPQSWELIELSASIPPEADFLLIGIAAFEDVQDDPPEEPEFAGHYVDGVELKLNNLNL